MSVVLHLPLIKRLAKREFDQRFRGSFLGWFWALIAPLAMLGVFTLVFGVVFEARWERPGPTTSEEYDFPIILFSGLILFNFFADQLNRAPNLILEHSNYVKKVVFPLGIIPIVSLISTLFSFTISFIAFLIIFSILYGIPHGTIILLPLVILPLAMVALGISYFLSSLGVFIRDLAHVTPPLATAMLFLSSVFYDPSKLPDSFQWIVNINPITPAVNHMRDVVFWGRIPDVTSYLSFFTISALVCCLGYVWFNKTKKAFADVL